MKQKLSMAELTDIELNVDLFIMKDLGIAARINDYSPTERSNTDRDATVGAWTDRDL